MREWSVKLEYRELDSCRVRETVYAERVPGASEREAIAGAISQAHERIRVGNPVDGTFHSVWARPLLELGEEVDVVAGIRVDRVETGFIYAGESPDLAWDPPARARVTGFYRGMPDSSGGAFAELGNGVTVFCPPDGRSAWPVALGGA